VATAVAVALCQPTLVVVNLNPMIERQA